nr:hypothetical protein [uncultured Holophaga sp.]
MSDSRSPQRRIEQVRDLIRDKGLSRLDLELLNEMIQLGGGDLVPLLEPGTDPDGREDQAILRLKRTFGLFLSFLNQFPEKRLGEARPAMGLVLTHALEQLGTLAQEAHRALLGHQQESEWVVQLLDLIASLRTMASSLDTRKADWGAEHWSAFLQESRPVFRKLFQILEGDPGGSALAGRISQQIKTLNRALLARNGRHIEAIRKLEGLLESALPDNTRHMAEPLLLVHYVISTLRVTLSLPLDRGIHWPAVEQVRGSLQWLWNHLGWSLPRIEEPVLAQKLPGEVRTLLKQLRQEHPPAFRIVGRALVSHLALLSLVEQMELAANASIQERYAQVPVFYVIETELGRLAERVYHPRVAEHLPKGSEEALLLGAFLRQAVLTLVQDQSTIRGLLQPPLVNQDSDQLASSLDNLKALLLSHQRQLMADLVGLFSPELRQRLFPDSPSLAEEGDRLRRRLFHLWEHLDPALQQIQVHRELQDMPRLALTLAQAQNRVAAFRRSPEFLLIRAQDRLEFERLAASLARTLESPEDLTRSLNEAAETVGEILRFLDVFLLRINGRIPLIRLDLTHAQEGLEICSRLQQGLPPGPERTKATHLLIQVGKSLGVRDPQTVQLLKRWVRTERSGKDSGITLAPLISHLERLSIRLEAAMS